ncbi:N-glycosylation protein-like protein [Ilyonectria robusta]
MVRLLTINAVNAYITSNVLYLAGGFQDPRLLLPGWIGIATVRSACLVAPTVTNTRNINSYLTDPDSVLPHRPPKNQHPQRNVHLHQRLLHRQLHQHGRAAGPHARPRP